MGAVTCRQFDPLMTHEDLINDDSLRREGNRFLGEALHNEISGVRKNWQYPKALADAIRSVIRDPNYIMFYEYIDELENEAAYVIVRVNRSKRILRLGLAELNDSLKKVVKHLELAVRIDRRHEEIFEMDVVFPDVDDSKNFMYLSDAAEDIQSFHTALNPHNPDTTSGRNYLAAFKFLSRCK